MSSIKRTYSAQVRYDDNGYPHYGVFADDRFMLWCPNVGTSAEVADAVSAEYRQGFENGNDEGYISAMLEFDSEEAQAGREADADYWKNRATRAEVEVHALTQSLVNPKESGRCLTFEAQRVKGLGHKVFVYLLCAGIISLCIMGVGLALIEGSA